ncbi:hypothetical protein HAHE_32480 [Haloferula helveola]|uniref:Uncharacterized protein n=1 Tax=Haloferula helveola TaxID=490095 RepID=A0ABM7RN80_9BACT|nr:hypothetical protein HAHE_32480 [Haloferula helveola]
MQFSCKGEQQLSVFRLPPDRIFDNFAVGEWVLPGGNFFSGTAMRLPLPAVEPDALGTGANKG